MPEKRGKLKLVREREAEGRTREIFDEVRHALRVPGIPILYQAYAAIPEFLDLHWRAFKPLLAGGGLFILADRLRGEAYTRAHNYFQLEDLCGPLDHMSFSSGAKHELGDVIELFNFKDTPVLLVASTQLLAFDQAIAHGEPPVAATIDLPVFREKPVLVEENVASPEIKRIYDEQGKRGLVVILGASEPAYVEMMAETVTAGDPTYTGPLAGVSLGLPVYHVTEPDVREHADAAVYQEQIGLSEVAMETEQIWKSIRTVRERTPGA